MTSERQIQVIPVDSVQCHPQNARVSDVPKIQRSIEEHGQVSPIVVQRSTMYVVKGNHVLEAVKNLGWKTIKAIIVDMDDHRALKFLVDDNATSDSSTYDQDRQIDLLEAVGGYEEHLEYLKEMKFGKKEKSPAPVPKLEIKTEEPESENDPVRKIVLPVRSSSMADFAQKVNDLQQLWKASTLTEVVTRAVDEAHDRWQAGVGADKATSRDTLPELVGTEF